jgi:hypothetical protein
MGRRDDRDAAGHRLEHRHAEALVERRVDEDARAAVEAWELLRRRVAELHDSGGVELRLVAPACSPGHSEREPAAQQAVRLDQRREVLAGLERRDRQRIGLLELHALPDRRELRSHARIRNVNPLRRHGERLRDVVAGEARVDDHDVTGSRRMAVLDAVHAARARMHPLGMVQRHEIVNHRRP